MENWTLYKEKYFNRLVEEVIELVNDLGGSFQSVEHYNNSSAMRKYSRSEERKKSRRYERSRGLIFTLALRGNID
jgi:hypothetical protein